MKYTSSATKKRIPFGDPLFLLFKFSENINYSRTSNIEVVSNSIGMGSIPSPAGL